MNRWGLINDNGGVTGVCLVKPGEGSNGWGRVDEFGQPASVPTDYFLYHPTYTGIEEITDENGQQLVKIPAFWVKTLHPSTGPYAGRPCWVLSPDAREGFHLHPAFKSPAGDMECIYIGAFLATDESADGITKYGSTPNKPPKVSVNLENFKTRIAAMGTSYHMITIYELAVIQWLFLVEFCDPDSQTLRGEGVSTSSVNVDDPDRPRYRGMIGLWAGTAQILDGLTRNAALDPSAAFDPSAATTLIVLMKNDGSRESVLTDYTMPSSSNWVTEMHWGSGDSYDFGDIFYPEKFDTESGSFADKYTTRATTVAPAFGGTSTSGSCGLYYLNVANGYSLAFSNWSTRVVKDGPLLSTAEPEPVARVSDRNIYVDAANNTVTIYDAAYCYRSSSTTGMLDIVLPNVTLASGYVRIFMCLYMHTGSGGFNVYIATTFGTTYWASTVGADVIPKALPESFSRLRFCTDVNDRKHILIGSETTSWAASRFHLREVTISGATYTYFTDGQGWEMSMIPSFEGTIDKEIASVTSVPDSVPYAGTTTGSANAYVISTPYITSLTTGKAVAFKIHVDSTGPSTLNWCGTGDKGLKKANGANVTNLKSGGIYTARYDGTNFRLQGEGGSGDATAADLLIGKTASVDAGDIVGTMSNRAGDTAALSSAVSGTTLKLLASNGYRNGTSDYVTIKDANFLAANILEGKSIFGLDGTALERKFAYSATTINIPTAQQGATTQVDFSITGLSFTPKQIYAAARSSMSGNVCAGGIIAAGVDNTVNTSDSSYLVISFADVVFSPGSVSGKVQLKNGFSGGFSATVNGIYIY